MPVGSAAALQLMAIIGTLRRASNSTRRAQAPVKPLQYLKIHIIKQIQMLHDQLWVQEREPGTLLRSLMQVLTKRGVAIQHALFLPPDSKYTKVTKSKGEDHLDLSWQFAIRSKWEALTKLASASSCVVRTHILHDCLDRRRCVVR